MGVYPGPRAAPQTKPIAPNEPETTRQANPRRRTDDRWVTDPPSKGRRAERTRDDAPNGPERAPETGQARARNEFSGPRGTELVVLFCRNEWRGGDDPRMIKRDGACGSRPSLIIRQDRTKWSAPARSLRDQE